MRVKHFVPARIGIQESPPNAVVPDLLHAPATVEKHSQHALPQVDDLLVLFRVGRVRCVVGHGMLFGYRRDDERWVKSGESIPECSELGIAAANL